MRLIINKLVLVNFILMSSAIISVGKAEALQLRLLWQKALPFEASDIIMASQSGDIILYSREARQIILYDKNGNKRFHWGPRVDRSQWE